MSEGGETGAAGNVLVLLGGDGESRRLSEVAVLAALRHLRLPLLLQEAGVPLASALAAHPACIVVAAGALPVLPEAERQELAAWVQAGGGLVNLDGDHLLPGLFRPGEPRPVTRAVTPQGRHYCLATRTPGQAVPLVRPLPTPVAELPAGWQTLLEAEDGRPLLMAGSWGAGRVLQWALPLPVWTFEYLGHGCGLDDLFWRGIVWAARKPFAAMPMPPFVTVRIDDASGSGSRCHAGPEGAAHLFRYVELLDRCGYRANIGLFIRDIPEQDHAPLRRWVEAGTAEFSPHAFTEINDVPEHLIYMTHDGREYSPQELDRNFAEVDAVFARFGVRPAPALNCHYYEMGARAVPYLLERGGRYVMTEMLAGTTYDDPRARQWFPPPYGHFGYILGPLPGHEELFDCLSQYNGPQGKDAGSSDALHGHTVFAHEAAGNDPEGAGRKAAAMIARGLDNMVFGVLMTHEQRIASLTLGQWEQVLAVANAGLAAYERLPLRYSEVCRYAQRWYGAHLEAVAVKPGRLECTFQARERANLMLSVFTEKDGEISRHLLPVHVGGREPVVVELP